MEYNIRLAKLSDAREIGVVTKKAFALYRDELHSNALVTALTESVLEVENDIQTNKVFVAVNSEDDSIIGSIRYCKISDELAYIYRFGVDPDIISTGIGTDLISKVIDECTDLGFNAIALHTNSRYYKLARYYYGKHFFVHSTSFAKGYIRALFIKELNSNPYDISPAFEK